MKAELRGICTTATECGQPTDQSRVLIHIYRNQSRKVNIMTLLSLAALTRAILWTRHQCPIRRHASVFDRTPVVPPALSSEADRVSVAQWSLLCLVRTLS